MFTRRLHTQLDQLLVLLSERAALREAEDATVYSTLLVDFLAGSQLVKRLLNRLLQQPTVWFRTVKATRNASSLPEEPLTLAE